MRSITTRPSLLFACVLNSINESVETQGTVSARSYVLCLHPSGFISALGSPFSHGYSSILGLVTQTMTRPSQCQLIPLIFDHFLVAKSANQLSLAPSCSAALASLRCSLREPISNWLRPFIPLSSTYASL